MADKKLAKELQKKANEFRKEIIEIVYNAKSGHTGGSLSEIDILTALYFHKLRVKPDDPHWQDRDRFVLSKGHASPGYYAVLAEKGYFSKEELKRFRKINSMLQGHPELATPGVDFAGGSLGQGMSFSIGLALAEKLDKKSYKIYTMIGDGESQEGVVWEASMAAAHYKLNNLVVILDKNQVQQTGKTKDIMDLGDVVAKWKAFGWNVIEIDGHNMQEILDALDEADMLQEKEQMPVMIIANTEKGKGVSFMELNHKFHGKAPNDDEYRQAIEELDRLIASS